MFCVPASVVFGTWSSIPRLRINSAGFRDDEEALRSPEVVVLGDSFAMGWGVTAPETFTSLLRRRTDLTILNTGVSSYGTVREKIAMSRVSLNNLKYLVVQYGPNDKDENLLFYLRNNTNRTLPQDQFDRVLRWYRESRRYYPGRSLDLLMSHQVFGRVFGPPEQSEVTFSDSWTEPDRQAQKERPPVTEAEAFVNALVHAGAPLPKSLRKIIVFSLDSYSPADQQMIDGLRAMKAAHRLDDISPEFVILRASDFITRKHYYLVDDHLRPMGHTAIADVLASRLQAKGLE